MEPQICMCDCIAGLQFIFDKYAGRDGNKETLTKDELKELFKAEAKGGGTQMPDEAMEGMFQAMDDDKNDEISFQEYMLFVAKLAILASKMKGCMGGQKRS
ncbi:hypothetical protein COCON_G00129610 [Conger conger]|uniref:EF-hand domain-containing protein n=1 Tax=Conger conger TaxID=82655 RepID=A0A9Q1HXC0_CONCO|nr:hypothetical protein COCON_G00129610 [Conger conger]